MKHAALLSFTITAFLVGLALGWYTAPKRECVIVVIGEEPVKEIRQ